MRLLRAVVASWLQQHDKGCLKLKPDLTLMAAPPALLHPLCVTALAARIYGAMECVSAVPLERWDVESTGAVQIPAQVSPHQLECLAHLDSAQCAFLCHTITMNADGNTVVSASTPCSMLQPGSSRFAAWVEGASCFDAGLFRLSSAEALGLEPQCRLLQESCWESMQVM